MAPSAWGPIAILQGDADTQTYTRAHHIFILHGLKVPMDTHTMLPFIHFISQRVVRFYKGADADAHRRRHRSIVSLSLNEGWVMCLGAVSVCRGHSWQVHLLSGCKNPKIRLSPRLALPPFLFSSCRFLRYFLSESSLRCDFQRL